MGYWDRPCFNYPGTRQGFISEQINTLPNQLFISDNISQKELMSWQVPGGVTIKDLSLVIISAIGYENEESLSFIFNVNSIL